MPTPIELILDPVSLIVFVMYGALFIWERVSPGAQLPQVKHWALVGLLSFTVYFFLSSYLPLLWDSTLASYQLFDLTDLHPAMGTLVGLVVYELGAWTYHRAAHKFDVLWRLHQTHHTARRLDTLGAFLLHPLDMVMWTAVSSISLVLVVGLTPQAATSVLLLITFLAVFQHANIKTPRWLGYLVQRPESHALHHAKDVHANNYCDLPVIVMLFGTFQNPASFGPETGFGEDRSERWGALLLLQDVNREPTLSPPSQDAPHSSRLRGCIQ